MKHLKHILGQMMILALILFVQCGKQREPQKKVLPPPPPISSGTVHSDVPYTTGNGRTFAVYLPSAYSGKHSWPVLYFFDAHARGALPVKRYRKLAEDFGMILIGSNDLKNGLEAAIIQNRVDALFEETAKRFRIKPGQKYIMGFSGGARSAVLTALIRSDVAGVIGCGAGFPRWNQAINHRFAYVALAGKGDFNLSELRVLNEKLKRTPIRHWLIEFKGKHEWPPAPPVEKALNILRLDAMRSGLMPSDPELIGRFVKSEMHLLDSLKQKKQWLLLAAEYRLFINTFKGMADIQSVQSALGRLLKSAAYRRQKEAERQRALKEVDLQKAIQEAFNKQDIPYLQNVYHKLSRLTKRNDDYWMAQRLTGFMSLLGYLYTRQALQKKDLQAARNYLRLYALTDAQNADRYYLQAWLDILQDNIPRAQQEAQKALQLGLDDQQKIFANPVFSVLELH